MHTHTHMQSAVQQSGGSERESGKCTRASDADRKNWNPRGPKGTLERNQHKHTHLNYHTCTLLTGKFMIFEIETESVSKLVEVICC